MQIISKNHFGHDLRQPFIKALSKLVARQNFVSEKVHAGHRFQPICLIFTDHTLQTFGNNCEKFHLKRLIFS
jgi:hypothetical protein